MSSRRPPHVAMRSRSPCPSFIPPTSSSTIGSGSRLRTRRRTASSRCVPLTTPTTLTLATTATATGSGTSITHRASARTRPARYTEGGRTRSTAGVGNVGRKLKIGNGKLRIGGRKQDASNEECRRTARPGRCVERGRHVARGQRVGRGRADAIDIVG